MNFSRIFQAFRVELKKAMTHMRTVMRERIQKELMMKVEANAACLKMDATEEEIRQLKENVGCNVFRLLKKANLAD